MFHWYGEKLGLPTLHGVKDGPLADDWGASRSQCVQTDALWSLVGALAGRYGARKAMESISVGGASAHPTM